jgi:hypothetical protein
MASQIDLSDCEDVGLYNCRGITTNSTTVAK